MGDRLFGNIVNPPKGPDNKRYTVPGMFVALVLIALVFAVQNAMAIDPPEIPNRSLASPYFDIFLPTPPPLPKPAAAKKVEVPSTEPSFPTEPPDKLYPEPERPAVDPGPEDDKGRVSGDGDKTIKSDPPPPPEPEKPQEPIRVGGVIRQPQKTHDVRPSYPPIAQAARVQGIVIIEATISPQGEVVGAKVLKSIPLLDQAALDAVSQWRFQPTHLNGVPVPVVMTVTVQFTLK